jgi:anti-sigma factor RsiW
MKHAAETDLALYASGDLSLWRRAALRVHVAGCDPCRKQVEEFRADSAVLRDTAGELPMGVNWDRLSREMTANIRVGLAAGECVAPKKHRVERLSWKPVAVMAGVAVLLMGAWVLNVPAEQTRSLTSGIARMFGGHSAAPAIEDRGTMVEASERGVELRSNGRTLTVSSGTAAPVRVSASLQGTARASYADGDTGQVTITAVYTQ